MVDGDYGENSHIKVTMTAEGTTTKEYSDTLSLSNLPEKIPSVTDSYFLMSANEKKKAILETLTSNMNAGIEDAKMFISWIDKMEPHITDKSLIQEFKEDANDLLQVNRTTYETTTRTHRTKCLKYTAQRTETTGKHSRFTTPSKRMAPDTSDGSTVPGAPKKASKKMRY